MPASQAAKAILTRLEAARKARGLTSSEIEEALMLGPGWVAQFEAGETVPDIDLLIALAEVVGTDLPSLVQGIDVKPGTPVGRALIAESAKDAVRLSFPYGDYDAVHELPGATLKELEEVVKLLRNGLAAGQKANAVADAYLKAVCLWPTMNPSDLWWFLIYRAFLDPFNHPATEARRALNQSWKRTAGWALERVVAAHYGEALAARGVRIFIADALEKRRLLPDNLARQLEADKVDILLSGTIDGIERFFGLVNVKASFAERRTDDVPLSEALVNKGYTSIFWTMDCKSRPAKKPLNRGELGRTLDGEGDVRSAKRRDFEVAGSFSACFSYNARTLPTPPGQEAAARIYRADFADPDDDFTRFVSEAWQSFRQQRAVPD